MKTILKLGLAILFIIQLTNAGQAQHLDYNDIPKFSLHSSDILLQRQVLMGTYCESVGQAAALLGHEEGVFEAWIFPFKILHDFHNKFRHVYDI